MNNPTTDSRPNQTNTKDRTEAADKQAASKSSHSPNAGKEVSKDKPENVVKQGQDASVKPADAASGSGRDATPADTKNQSARPHVGGAGVTGIHNDPEIKPR